MIALYLFFLVLSAKHFLLCTCVTLQRILALVSCMLASCSFPGLRMVTLHIFSPVSELITTRSIFASLSKASSSCVIVFLVRIKIDSYFCFFEESLLTLFSRRSLKVPRLKQWHVNLVCLGEAQNGNVLLFLPCFPEPITANSTFFVSLCYRP